MIGGWQSRKLESLMLSFFKHLIRIRSLPRRFQDMHCHCYIPREITSAHLPPHQPDSYPSRLPMPNTIPRPQLHERVTHGLPFLDLAAPLHFTLFDRTLASRSWRDHPQARPP